MNRPASLPPLGTVHAPASLACLSDWLLWR